MLPRARCAGSRGVRVSDFQIDAGNTAWMLAASALVLFMTPGLAFFYGGLTRSKNVVGTIMHSFITIGVVGVLWVVVGYSLAFGPDQGLGLIGNLEHFGLSGVGVDSGAGGVPDLLFMAFQMMFAIITPALITGAFAERARFGPFLLFIALWSLIVYAPIAHWVFGVNGWLNTFSGEGVPADIGINGLDFAGGLAIHVNAGVAALAAVFVFGKRRGYGTEPMEPHDITMVVLGAAMLWFGWFGFNAGSAVGATGQAVYAFVNTNVAAAMAALTWTLISWKVSGKPSVVGAASGAVAGLVAVTPASGYVEPMEALAIGFGAGLFCYFAVRFAPVPPLRRLPRRRRRPRCWRALGGARAPACSPSAVGGTRSRVPRGPHPRRVAPDLGPGRRHRRRQRLLLHRHLHHPQGAGPDHGRPCQSRRTRRWAST